MSRRSGNTDYSKVIRAIEHHLQYDGHSGVHPYESHEEAARNMESGDSWRALADIAAELDRAKKA